MHFRNLNEDIDHVLVTEKQLEETVTRIAGEIDRDQRERDSDLLLLGILKGSVVFMGDLFLPRSRRLQSLRYPVP